MSQESVLEFFQVFNSPELNINVIDNVISFSKNNNTYNVTIKIKSNNILFTSHDNSLTNIHFTDILNKSKLTSVDQIPELIEFIHNLHLNNYCIVCHNKLDFQSDSFVTCGGEECLYRYEELIVGNQVIDKFRQDEDMCKFLLESAIDAVKCERKYDIFEPFPTHFMKFTGDTIKRGNLSKLEGKNYDNAKDFDKIDKLIYNFDPEKMPIYLNLCKTDQELADKIGKDLYIFIRFVLLSCKVDIIKNDDMLGLKSDKFKIYKIVHPIDKEDEFKKIAVTNAHFLFHGSRWCNWYSILRNGLKNCSHSKLMTAGAAHGSGIYLSDDINVSYGYGISGNKSIVGVFELVDKQKYHKGGAVYVCDNEKMLIQRYLLIIPNSHKYDFFKDINSIFNKTIYEEKLNSTVKYNKKSIAKIIREYQQIMKSNPDKLGFRIDVNPDYPFVWKIFICNLDNEHLIAQDMKKFNIKEIELEIRFPDNYPFSPPFLRVVSPRFMHLTGHITVNGSFCNELLTEKGWSPSYTVESIITSLMSEIIEGGGRIDPQKYKIPYGYEEAKSDFIRVAKSHGWM
ncbi:bifunctional polyADP-ribose polymerase and ubiquitin-conjugating enzyme E2 domain protein [Fadolivirus algeromassiliense]|jgi:ubiquitin-protein ligase|uniref:E2 ubiquitin-conjugating enzyme n=1 Tax=Fadolivirus FV1/VV64 TaxID=3070911 RepID=A0A7D3V914_9VIRU|nr:bifunctional polyADP-ribose polymerase and ubiquitin-conjugating enzyme E2 domain protein [Fadolivirus algeromassiliense]QKF94397.1 bifunctional polyADP-ribose polymerase and ubiquitin-conjugating enzyme E2 domain protein [Fadolivirus FV1/VV64]